MKPASTWTHEITARLLSVDYAPRIRPDVERVRLPTSHGVRLIGAGGARWLDLSPLDYDVARHMDGVRSLTWLAELARQQDPAQGAERVERLVVELYSRELLVPVDPASGGAASEGWDLPGPRGDGRPEGGGFAEPSAAARDRLAAVPLAQGSSAGAYLPTDDEDGDPEATTVGESSERAEPLERGTAAVEEDAASVDESPAAVEDDAGSVGEGAESAEEAADGEADPGEGSENTEGVEAEQQVLWEEMRSIKWHQRGWVRLLLVLAGLTGIAAVVPYPLRVTSDAVIIPSERAYVRAKRAGILAAIEVDEGQKVRKGELLARLDDRELRSERRMAEAEIERIEAEVALLRRGARPEEIAGQTAVVAAARNAVDFARKEAVRAARMAAQGVGSAQARDQARHELGLRQKAYAEVSAKLRLIKAGARSEDIDAREADLDRASAHLAFIDEQLALTVIEAPIDGVVLTPKFRERLHEQIDAGGLVCEIAKTDRMRAEVYLPEREMDSVALGQPVVVKVQSYPTREFTGKVDFLAPAVEKRGDENRMRVVVELDNREGLLRQDMTGYGEVDYGPRSVLNLVTRRLLRWVRVRFLL